MARFGVAALLLTGLSCTREKNLDNGVERIAVARLENLSDPQWDWIGGASAPLAVESIVGSKKYFAAVGGDPIALRARYRLEGYYEIAGQTLRLRAILRDTVRQSTTAAAEASGPLAEGPAGLLRNTVSQLVSHRREQRPAKPSAVEAYGKAQLRKDAEAVTELLQKAVDEDPGFVPAVTALTHWMLQTGRTTQAREVLQRALATSPKDWDEIAVRLNIARLEGNAAALQELSERAANYWPTDTNVLLQISGAMLRQHRYGDAVTWIRKATELEPTNGTNWNQLAYAQAFAGANKEAAASAAEYLRIAPNDANAHDSSGEVAFYGGQFQEAETHFLESQAKAPQFMGGQAFAKAAFARFFGGDTAGADTLFQRFLESRRAQQDPLVDVRQAHWLRLTGRAQQAYTAIEKLASGSNEIAGRAAALQAVWLVEDGKRAQAAELVKLPQPRFASPAVLAVAVMAGFLAQPHAENPEEWARRATQGVMAQIPPQTRNLLVAYALLLDGHAKQAVELLSVIWQQSQPANNDEIRVVLAAAKIQAGDRPGGVELLRRYPLPPQPGESVFASLFLPRYLEWRKSAGL